MTPFPNTLLNNIRWSLAGDKFGSQPDFEAAVEEYQAFFGGEPWQPHAVAIASPIIRIQYNSYNTRGDKPILEFTADNGAWFSVGELLFKIHNAVVDDLSYCDHHYFEGLTQAENQTRSQPPLYFIWQGS